ESPKYFCSADSTPAEGYFSSSVYFAVLISRQTDCGKIVVPSLKYSSNISVAAYCDLPACGPGFTMPSARIPPVDVPAIKSNSSQIGLPDCFSMAASTTAGMIPRMPPPSIARILSGLPILFSLRWSDSFHVLDQRGFVLSRQRCSIHVTLVAIALDAGVELETQPDGVRRIRVEAHIHRLEYVIPAITTFAAIFRRLQQLAQVRDGAVVKIRRPYPHAI